MFDVVLDGLHMPECPRWHEEQLWLVDVWGHQVLRVDGHGRRRVVCEFPGDEEPAGLGWLPDGRMLVVGMLQRVVYVVDDGAIGVHADLRDLTQFPLNDMIVTPEGTAYVSGFGWDVWGDDEYADSDLFRVQPDGTVDVVAPAMKAPNGLALSGDGRMLVVAEPAGGQLSWFRVADDGRLTDRRVTALEKADDADFVTPDGICLDAEGAVWVADPMGRRVLHVFDDGRCDRVLPVADGHPLACVLGGPDRMTLYVAVGAATSKRDRPVEPGGRVLATAVPVPGDGRP